MRTSRPTRDLKLFLPVASLCAGALLLGRLPEQQGLAGHQKLMHRLAELPASAPFHANHAHPSPEEGSVLDPLVPDECERHRPASCELGLFLPQDLLHQRL